MIAGIFNLLMQHYSLVNLIYWFEMKFVFHNVAVGMPNLQAASVRLLDAVFFEFALNKDAHNSVRIVKTLNIFLLDCACNNNVLKI